ncbi:hypothetical protein ASPTUDRAFT_39066 [Aspergillus tubingensis CBS 134.48]|uniref:Uncharacterized protein n=1 Tax=Aspergillus tubingensis (strain CBS 134.48) TaxID=767770 RepID=A0A1L9NAK2_ASPTC|nr:hypothetical protein ASPTUDRAFT_39066 [Aspergillus tubingensis CBS 134.48]
MEVKEFDAPSVGNSPPSQGLEGPHPRGRTMARKNGGPDLKGPKTGERGGRFGS